MILWTFCGDRNSPVFLRQTFNIWYCIDLTVYVNIYRRGFYCLNKVRNIWRRKINQIITVKRVNPYSFAGLFALHWICSIMSSTVSLVWFQHFKYFKADGWHSNILLMKNVNKHIARPKCHEQILIIFIIKRFAAATAVAAILLPFHALHSYSCCFVSPQSEVA